MQRSEEPSLLDALTTAWLRKLTGKSGQAVADWKNGKISATRLEEIEKAVRELLPERKEAAPPEWAERLLEGVFALEAKGGVSDEELAQAQAKVAAFLAVARQGRPPLKGGGAGGASGA